jgi:oligopeptidase B
VYARRRGSLEAPEEIVLDANALAAGHEFFTMWMVEVSPDARTVAYAVDTVGRRINTLRFRDLETGRDLPDAIEGVTYNGAWANDGRTFFYVRQDPVTLRWDRVYRHELGTDPASDALIYEEPDEEFSTFVYRTKSERFVVIASQQTLTSEARVIDADDPTSAPRLIAPREPGHEYWVDHAGDWFYVRSNDDAPNFRLLRAPVATSAREHWEEIVPHRAAVLLEGIELFRDFIVLGERRDGLLRLRVMRPDGGDDHYVDFGEPAYAAWPLDNVELDSGVLRYTYTSLTTPESVFDYDMATRNRTLRKQREVLGGFDKRDYATERLWAPARDGARVPVSLVYRKDRFRRDGSNPLLLYGYGSYGYSMDAEFSSSRLSLLDRGFIFVIAHVRGGQELGRHWYEDGKLLNKKNTFTDFIDVAEFLVRERYTRAERLFAVGGSAGGLLMGAVANMAPGLFEGIVLQVPFVDAVTTMLDEEIPLTTGEYDEWGDPRERGYYDYMLSYSPYDNVGQREYPSMLVMTGFEDSQVQYWEPAKYVAKLRALKTDDNVLVLRTNMEAGHGGATGRLKQHRETALEYAFLLDLADIHD